MDREHEVSLEGREIAGKYVIESRIGAGSRGSVHVAHQIELERRVAIKLLRPATADVRDAALRFTREAQAASCLVHPNLTGVSDFGEEPDGLLYVVMDLVAGRDLAAVMKEDGVPFEPARIVDLLSQVLSALVFAHDRGVVHPDLDATKIVVSVRDDDDGLPVEHVKVRDLGLAETVTPDAVARDLAAVGAILHEVLTGLPVAHGWRGTAKDPRRLGAFDDRLVEVCLRALSRDPDARFPSARAMRSALREAIAPTSSLAPLAIETTLAPRPIRAMPTRRWARHLAAAPILALGILAGIHFGKQAVAEERQLALSLATSSPSADLPPPTVPDAVAEPDEPDEPPTAEPAPPLPPSAKNSARERVPPHRPSRQPLFPLRLLFPFRLRFRLRLRLPLRLRLRLRPSPPLRSTPRSPASPRTSSPRPVSTARASPPLSAASRSTPATRSPFAISASQSPAPAARMSRSTRTAS